MISPHEPALPPRATETAETADVVVRAREALEGVTGGPWEVTGGVVWCETVIAVPDPSDPGWAEFFDEQAADPPVVGLKPAQEEGK